jgi:Calx-beta domain
MRTAISGVLGFVILSCFFAGCSGGGGSDGNQGVISFTGASFRQNEDGTLSANEITLERVGGTAAVSVTITFTGGTATGGVDYDSTPIVVSWLAGDTTDKVVSVPVIDDNNDEQPFETATMALGSPTGGAVIGAGFASLEINDDDIAGSVEFDSATYAYNEDGSVATQVITVIRTGGMDGDIFVTVTSSDGGSGNAANSDPLSVVEPVDYQPINISVFFADQSTTPVVVAVTIVNDLLPEADEHFTVSLSNPTNGADLGGITVADVTIIDDDLFLQVDNPAGTLNGLFGSSLANIGQRIAVGAPGNLTLAGEVFSVNVGDGTVHEQFDGGAGAQSFGRALSAESTTLAIGGNGEAWSFGGDAFFKNYTERYSVIGAEAGFGSTILAFNGRMIVGAPGAQLGGSIEPSGILRSYDAIVGGGFLQYDGVGDGMLSTGLAGYSGGNFIAGAPGSAGQVLLLGGSPLALQGLINNPFPQSPSIGFGTSVAVNPTNGDIVVGVPDADFFAQNDGRVHVFGGGPPDTIFPPPPIVADGRFGAHVFVLADGRICVQQPGGGLGVAGRVFVFAAGTNVLAQTIDHPLAAPNAGFGAAMCEIDGALVIGAPNGPGVTQTGQVFIMKLN